MNQEKIGKFISVSRKNKDLTQEQLAEKLGVSINAVSKWERGLNLPDVSLMKTLCNILDITPNYIFNKALKSATNVMKERLFYNLQILNTRKMRSRCNHTP